MRPTCVVVGGGAAGFFAAVVAAEAGADVTLLERGHRPLAKVRISGGGRCNVTHACFDPKVLIQSYPRGGRELLGPFHRFQPKDAMDWFKARGADLRVEPDGRVFPSTNKSQTIIDALTGAARRAGVRLVMGVDALDLQREVDGFRLARGDVSWGAERLLLATGSGGQGYEWARLLGHSVVSPVPSLFTFTVKDPRLEGLSGLGVDNAKVSIEDTSLAQSGPVLVTHWGLSGPAVLKLSAWAARTLHERGYHAGLRVNWVGRSSEEMDDLMAEARRSNPRGAARARPLGGIPQRLWDRLGRAAGVDAQRRWADLTAAESARWTAELTGGRYTLCGKGAFKEEFVTAGGVSLKEVDFSTMESRLCPNLFFAGEILDVDGVTGGYNFQNAWTTGWLAGRAMAKGR